MAFDRSHRGRLGRGLRLCRLRLRRSSGRRLLIRGRLIGCRQCTWRCSVGQRRRIARLGRRGCNRLRLSIARSRRRGRPGIGRCRVRCGHVGGRRTRRGRARARNRRRRQIRGRRIVRHGGRRHRGGFDERRLQIVAGEVEQQQAGGQSQDQNQTGELQKPQTHRTIPTRIGAPARRHTTLRRQIAMRLGICPARLDTSVRFAAFYAFRVANAALPRRVSRKFAASRARPVASRLCEVRAI